jgi:hypothetical protein
MTHIWQGARQGSGTGCDRAALAFSVYGVHGLICPESAVGSNRAALNTNADKMAQA